MVSSSSTPSSGRIATSASFDRSTKRPDRDLAQLVHHLDEQAVRLGRVLVGHEVVRLLEVERVDVGEVDEVLDLDRAGSPSACSAAISSLLDDDVLAGLDLVALHDLVGRDLFAGLLRDPAVADAGAGVLLELVEADVLRLRGRHQPHRHRHEPEADRTGPDRAAARRASWCLAGRQPPMAYYLRRSWPARVQGAQTPSRGPQHGHRVEVDGRRLRLSNLDKVLYPATGFTKGQVIDYYARIAPAMLPHLRGPPGHDGAAARRGRRASGSSRSAAPGHRPEWVDTVPLDADSDHAGVLDRRPARPRVGRQPGRARAAHAPGPGRRTRGARPRWCSTSTPARRRTCSTARASRSSCATCSTSSGCTRW